MFLYPKVSIHCLFCFLFLSSSSFPWTQITFCAFPPPLKYLSSQSVTVPISVSLPVQFFPSQSPLHPDASITNTADPAFHILHWLLITSAWVVGSGWEEQGKGGGVSELLRGILFLSVLLLHQSKGLDIVMRKSQTQPLPPQYGVYLQKPTSMN